MEEDGGTTADADDAASAALLLLQPILYCLSVAYRNFFILLPCG
jgi:hypothetical protein